MRRGVGEIYIVISRACAHHHFQLRCRCKNLGVNLVAAYDQRVGISYGCKLRKHIKIDAALNLFPKKVRPYIVVLGDILFIVFAVYIVYTGTVYSLSQMQYNMRSPALKIPNEFVYMSTVVGFGLAVIRQIQTIIYRVKCLKNGEEFEG